MIELLPDSSPRILFEGRYSERTKPPTGSSQVSRNCNGHASIMPPSDSVWTVVADKWQLSGVHVASGTSFQPLRSTSASRSSASSK
jgi:hypothetical protein